MHTQTMKLNTAVKEAIMANDMPWFISDKTTDNYNGDNNTEDFPQLTHCIYDVMYNGEGKNKLAEPIMRDLKNEFDIILNLEVVEHVENLNLYLSSCFLERSITTRFFKSLELTL